MTEILLEGQFDGKCYDKSHVRKSFMKAMFQRGMEMYSAENAGWEIAKISKSQQRWKYVPICSSIS